MTNDVLIPKDGWINIQSPIEIPNLDKQLWFKLSVSVAKTFGRTEIPNVFKLLAINQDIFWRWLFFASRLMPYGELTDREREIIILRVAWLCRCRYEWGQHIEIGQNKAKLSDEDIVNISKGINAFANPKEQLIIKACNEFINKKAISTETWNLLSKYYNNKLMIEISVLIGHYEMLAGILNSTGLQLEPKIEQYYKMFNERIKGME
ncbi:MAG TPA: carboxymuconolactone decarboxylase family protein [Chitinophagales bacterium]|nr:carboxymuconolactone decarboxylase family protein [Chitinophagales bacterium]HMV02096.1 carboxymuconolactone decarboxylase family protein [Chitinophagales bacterium]HMZ69107.1 carboxymuconolactone decarboxylase family protein [Chitinophagales bacterium]HMZ93052.1 carboxymuconolactone decarboxylase family protein [Chitinophagales bacterium]HND46194.1 carboxymuconolactone decarboxylase family protein [Chitinophagales bacterium]